MKPAFPYIGFYRRLHFWHLGGGATSFTVLGFSSSPQFKMIWLYKVTHSGFLEFSEEGSNNPEKSVVKLVHIARLKPEKDFKFVSYMKSDTQHITIFKELIEGDIHDIKKVGRYKGGTEGVSTAEVEKQMQKIKPRKKKRAKNWHFEIEDPNEFDLVYINVMAECVAAKSIAIIGYGKSDANGHIYGFVQYTNRRVFSHGDQRKWMVKPTRLSPTANLERLTNFNSARVEHDFDLISVPGRRSPEIYQNLKKSLEQFSSII